MGSFYIFTALHLNQQQICICEAGNLCCCFVSKYCIPNFLCTTYFFSTAQLHIFWALMKICWYIALKRITIPNLILYSTFIISRCPPIKMIRENNTGMDTYWKLSCVHKQPLWVRIMEREFSIMKLEKGFPGKAWHNCAPFQEESWKNQCWKDSEQSWAIPHPILELHDILPSCCIASARTPTGRKLIQYYIFFLTREEQNRWNR